jgi:hypothetical protein
MDTSELDIVLPRKCAFQLQSTAQRIINSVQPLQVMMLPFIQATPSPEWQCGEVTPRQLSRYSSSFVTREAGAGFDGVPFLGHPHLQQESMAVVLVDRRTPQ